MSGIISIGEPIQSERVSRMLLMLLVRAFLSMSRRLRVLRVST